MNAFTAFCVIACVQVLDAACVLASRFNSVRPLILHGKSCGLSTLQYEVVPNAIRNALQRQVIAQQLVLCVVHRCMDATDTIHRVGSSGPSSEYSIVALHGLSVTTKMVCVVSHQDTQRPSKHRTPKEGHMGGCLKFCG